MTRRVWVVTHRYCPGWAGGRPTESVVAAVYRSRRAMKRDLASQYDQPIVWEPMAHKYLLGTVRLDHGRHELLAKRRRVIA